MTSFPTPQLIETNGVTLEVFVAGEKGKPIVLCHGWPEHAYSWRYQIAPLVEAGYHVIVPNQRGYGASSRPEAVEDYDMTHMTGDLAGLLDHFGYDDAVFVGHDWGAIIVWGFAMMHPTRINRLINMSVPFMERGDTEWVGFWEEMLGPDMYIVHFNRQPGVAERAFEANTDAVLRGMYRTDQWLDAPSAAEPLPGMPIINLAEGKVEPGGKLMMSEEDLGVFVEAFNRSGFTAPINWYRNFTRNWGILGDYEQKVHVPTLMIYGEYDMVPKSPTLGDHVADLEVQTLDCGHWIQQERPEETNRIMMDWLGRHS
jgi:pimeloyl-ACP methyl ester carboxylesterase